MPRFLHSGDWQLGMKRRFLGEDAQARFDEARFDAIRRLGDVAERERCDCVVVCGDVFESNAVDRRTVARALDALRGVRVPVVLLPGNHDPLDGASVFDTPAFTRGAPDHVHVLRDATPLRVRPDLEVVGAPWHSKRPGRDLLAEALDGLPAPAGTRVALAHGAVDVLSPDRDDPAAIDLANAERAIRDGAIHYLALGDRHSRTRVGETDRVHYAGAPEPTDWGEIDPGQVLVVDVDPSRVRVEAHRVGTWCFERRAGVALNSAEDLDALAAWLDGLPDKARTIVRLSWEGTLDLRGHARLEALVERARDVFACVDVWEPECALALLPDDADFEALGLSGFAARAVEKLRADAAGAPEAEDALALLVRLATGAEGDAA